MTLLSLGRESLKSEGWHFLPVKWDDKIEFSFACFPCHLHLVREKEDQNQAKWVPHKGMDLGSKIGSRKKNWHYVTSLIQIKSKVRSNKPISSFFFLVLFDIDGKEKQPWAMFVKAFILGGILFWIFQVQVSIASSFPFLSNIAFLPV